MITDKELDVIIRQPRPSMGMNKTNVSMYVVYIVWGSWKTMEPGRMLLLCDRMLKDSSLQLGEAQLEKVRSVIDQLKANQNGEASTR